ncbi:MAG: sensor domain-containing diguanylate cyclase [Spirochaetales bacterium]|nr:sensor domain-containing diguanylate cyclase [Spirochaetales bacterium]
MDLETFFSVNLDMLCIADTEGVFLKLNDSWTRSLGYEIDLLEGKNFMDFIHPEDRDEIIRRYRESMYDFQAEYRIIRPDGQIRWIWASTFHIQGDGKNSRLAGIAQDVTERKQLEEKFRESSIRDGLTGLYNRRHVYERLEPLVDKSRREETLFALAILDIDHFKNINDTYGHVAGDQVLKELARILKENIRTYDLVGRYGGEEFIIVFINADREKGGELAGRILDIVRKPVVHSESGEIHFTFSCGVTDSRICIEQKCPLDELIPIADKILYKAKNAGRNRVMMGGGP